MTEAMREGFTVAARPMTGADGDLRPFQVHVPEATLTDMRRRINATRWPDRETVPDTSQGVQLATVQALARYWARDYDWRKVEARLNAVPNYVTNIDGVDIHFIHVRSKHREALPLIITHGWPGSVLEQLKVIEPLTNPTAHGGSAVDAFHVVIPSLPGHLAGARLPRAGTVESHARREECLGPARVLLQQGPWLRPRD